MIQVPRILTIDERSAFQQGDHTGSLRSRAHLETHAAHLRCRYAGDSSTVGEHLVHAREHGFRSGEMRGVDPYTRSIRFAEMGAPDGRVVLGAHSIGYDILALSIGSDANDFAQDEVLAMREMIPKAAEWCARTHWISRTNMVLVVAWAIGTRAPIHWHCSKLT